MPGISCVKVSHPVPLWRAEGRVHLVVIAAMCVLPESAILYLLTQLPWKLPVKLEMAVDQGGAYMMMVGLLSLFLTPVAVGVGAWSICKSKIERRVKVAIAWILGAQVATVLVLLAMTIVGGMGSGGRLPH